MKDCTAPLAYNPPFPAGAFAHYSSNALPFHAPLPIYLIEWQRNHISLLDLLYDSKGHSCVCVPLFRECANGLYKHYYDSPFLEKVLHLNFPPSVGKDRVHHKYDQCGNDVKMPILKHNLLHNLYLGNLCDATMMC